MQKLEYVWFNGKLVPWDEATVHVTAHVLHYGSSVFEGMRAYATPKGPAVLGMKPHVDRLFNSCKIYRMELPYSKEEISQAIKETIRANKHDACYIRPLVYRGAEVLGINPRKCPVETAIITMEWGRYLGPEAIEQGVDVGVSSWRRMGPDTHPAMGKIGGNYVNSQFIVMEAQDHGYTEGIALDVAGYVSEGSGENIFVVFRNVIYTPPWGASILMGVTRDFVIQLAKDLGYEVREQMIPREMLYIADEVFFSGTAAEISPIRSVDKVPVGAGSRGPITRRLQEEFFALTSGEKEDRFGWLTPVNE
jgi:branched-chain amino acid aminotransferase